MLGRELLAVTAVSAAVVGVAWALGQRCNGVPAVRTPLPNPRTHAEAYLLGYMQGFDDARSGQN
ncbi:hypothetical protein GCM10009827_104850 [Dactylosporangium maewongense]|uniref:Secreted protein n=1 Tax=Dactylosporangium maewongense TaxID=634393 RepID=A0ABP4NR67_9ACTN